MLTCKEIGQKANHYIDGELSFKQRVIIRTHMLMCVYCRRYVQQLSTISKVVGLSRSPECSDVHADEIVERLLGDKEQDIDEKTRQSN